ncbi:MAG: sodium/solute symporter [Candidatus Dadabacteria bacterium]|nr:sodium/solute symporter [Candidatus Dadabacteria bacterium]
MILDLAIILTYFVVIMIIGIWSRAKSDVGVEEYFLSSRSLKWPYIAVSTIATNVQANHFIAMAGSAYIFGLAQANLEINAIFGILIAAFVFVPIYLRMKVITITQFFEARLGAKVALVYSLFMIILYSFMYLGTALFWAAYAANGVFGELFNSTSLSVPARLGILIVFTGAFSAVYTYMGGLRAVVRTDVVQFCLLVLGGFVILFVAIHHLGGWSELWNTTGDLMHLHLPSDHDTLPWIGIFGMLLLNLNYWGANQVILQRALAAKDLKQAQIGLLVGGVLKYVMALIIIVPGIALAGILKDNPLKDPDFTYLTLVNDFLPAGVSGLILTGLFASLMSTLDSIYNSVSTLWSIDIYKRYLNPSASESQIVRMGRYSIMASFITGALFAFIVIYVKFGNPEFPLTHWFNSMSYYIKIGFVIIIMSAMFLYSPPRRLVLFTMLFSIIITYAFQTLLPELNYFVRTSWVIVLGFVIIAIPTIIKNGFRLPEGRFFEVSHRSVLHFGIILALSLIGAHIIFH